MWRFLVVGGLLAGAARADTPSGAPAEPPPNTDVHIAKVVAHNQTSLGKAEVTRKIEAAYLAGIRRCYLRVLATSPDAAGGATIAFTVSAVGRATTPKVNSFDRALTKCVAGLVGSWRFPIPMKFADPTTAKFTVALELAVRHDEPTP